MDNRDMTGWEDYMNNNAIQIFKNEEFGEVRTVFENDDVWFIARDVATILGYKKPENAIANHVDDEDKTSTLIQGSGSNYKSKTVLINESGLYSLVLSSKLPSAKRFKHWVTHEVIPTARRITCALETVSFQGNIDGLVYSKNGTATTTSRKIAEVFGKSHKEVLRLLMISLRAQRNRHNFAPITLSKTFTLIVVTASSVSMNWMSRGFLTLR